MQLSTGNRSVLAYFITYSDAANAVNELKQQGYTDINLDQISLHPDVSTFYDFQNLNSVTNQNTYRNKYVIGSHPASNMAGNSINAGYSFIVSLVTPNEKAKNAITILKNNNALV